MTIRTSFGLMRYLECDGCHACTEDFVDQYEFETSKLGAGWQLGPPQDICPECLERFVNGDRR